MKKRAFTREDQTEILKTSIHLRETKEKGETIRKVSIPDESIIAIRESQFRAGQLDDCIISATIVRSKMFDGSARQIFPSDTICSHPIPSHFGYVPSTGYDTPTDRIARYYNPPTAGLTMKLATKVAKAYELHPPVKMKHKAPLAPDAYAAKARIAEIAASGSTLKPKPIVVEEPKPVVEESSRINMTSKHKIIYPTVVPTNRPTVINYDNWNPAPMIEVVVDPLAKVSRRVIIERMHKTINSVLINGVPSSASKNVPLPAIPTKVIDNILARLRMHAYDHQAVCVEKILKEELEAVDREYSFSAARAFVEYALRDPAEVINYGINLTKLADDLSADLWINREYQVKEWRVYRKTGLDRASIKRIFNTSEARVCSTLPIMLTIQGIWSENSLPNSWWEGMKSFSRANYSTQLLTDVNDESVKAKFPIFLPEFLSHIDMFSKSVREGMTEFWLTEVGNKLSQYISSLDAADGKCIPVYEDSFDHLESSLDDGSVISSSIVDHEPSVTKEANRVLNNRIALELSKSTSSVIRGGSKHASTTGSNSSHQKGSCKAEKLLNSAAVLLSRQLRTMC